MDILNVVKARGMSVRIDPGPPAIPKLVCPKGTPTDAVTEALMEALKAWRLEIIAEIESYGVAADSDDREGGRAQRGT
jgi:hypothetical protein